MREPLVAKGSTDQRRGRDGDHRHEHNRRGRGGHPALVARAHRAARASQCSCQAVTGSSASQRSTSALSAPADLVPILGLQCQRLQADRLQRRRNPRVERPRPGDLARQDLLIDLARLARPRRARGR